MSIWDRDFVPDQEKKTEFGRPNEDFSADELVQKIMLNAVFIFGLILCFTQM